ncbi:Epidermal growth factor-binding protein type B [Coemansia spiralis]|nr:Epidermal growth factor-binding protein type B [Coemansia spiralis]
MYKPSLLVLAQCLLAACVQAHPPTVKAPAAERVIGGTAAPANAFPSVVTLEILSPLGVGLCGGTLLNNHTVVTAAHCVYDYDTNTYAPASSVHVGYGSNSRLNQTIVTAVAVHVNPKFSPLDTMNDIAIITIAPIPFSASVQPAPIYSGPLETGTALTAVGWGLTIPGGNFDTLPNNLQDTQIIVGTPDECRKLVPTYQSSNGPQICTQNSLRPGSDTCQGDSGTGVYIKAGGQNYLAGLTSFGAGPKGDPTCALGDGLAFYTHIYYYMPFILEYGRPVVTGPGHTAKDPKSFDRPDRPVHGHRHHRHHDHRHHGHRRHGGPAKAARPVAAT